MEKVKWKNNSSYILPSVDSLVAFSFRIEIFVVFTGDVSARCMFESEIGIY